jgi:hypothetical protein
MVVSFIAGANWKYPEKTTDTSHKQTLSLRLRFTDSDYPIGIFKLFLSQNVVSST